MCLAIPACVMQLRGSDRAVVNLGGVRKTVSTALLDNVTVGDYVIIHVGYALAKLDQLEAQRTLQLFQELS
jgi:hydrogenase expression/formation protein HypC